jgi:hypothetical protein
MQILPEELPFVRRLMSMTFGDISVLQASLDQQEGEAILVTSQGSANDKLWSDFVELGWMVRKPDPPLPGVVPTKLFALTDRGKEPLKRIVDGYRRESDRRSRAMLEIYRNLCIPFVNNLKAQIKSVQGFELRDVIALTAMTTAGIIKISFSKEEHDAAINSIAQETRRWIPKI